MISVTSQVGLVQVVIKPSAKVRRMYRLNTGDEDAESNRENVDGDIQSF